MLIPKELIIEAKEKLGEDAAHIIARDLQLEKFDEKTLKSICYFHDEDSESFVWNPKDNCFKCFGCQKNYGIIDHYMYFNKMTYLGAIEKLFDKVGIKYKFGEKGVRTHRDYRYPKREENDDRSQVEKYLSLRGISKATLDYTDVQSDNQGNIVFHFYDLNDVLTLVKYRPARKVRDGENKSWCQKDADTKPVLFNMNRIDPTKPLLITEGEIDALSVIEAGYTNCVSVPLGAGNLAWIEENWDFLQQFEKIILWADNDQPGIKMRKDASSRLGTWRTYYVDLPEEITCKDGSETKVVKDANAVLYYCGKDAVLDFINNANETPVVGIMDLADVEDFELEKAQGLYSKIKPIDDIVYKFLFGSVILTTGLRGSGKSSLLNQLFICEALEQGYDVFLYTAELSPPVVKSWIEYTMAGRENIKMKDRFNHIINPDAKTKMREWYGKRIYIYDDISNKYEDIIDKAINAVRRYGIKILVLDNLMTIDIGAGDNNVLQKQKEFIVKLVGIAQQYNILIILVAHPRKTMAGATQLTGDDISGASELGNLAQYIISVHRYTEKEKRGEKGRNGAYKSGKEPIEFDVGIDILKNRYTGRIGRGNLYFDYDSYRFYSHPKELWKRYAWDKERDKKAYRTDDPNEHSPFDD